MFFNNMIPVPYNEFEMIFFNKIINIEYRELLKNQYEWCNKQKDMIMKKANKLYFLYSNNKLPINIKKRCCDFNLLESKCMEYIEENIAFSEVAVTIIQD